MEMSSRRDRYLHIPYQNKIFYKCYIGIRHPTILIPSQHYAPIRPFRCCNQRLSPQIARGSVGSWLPQMEIEYCISEQELVFFSQNTELRITDSSSNIWYKFSTVIHRHYPLLSPTRSNYHSIRSFSLSQDSWSLKWLNLWWPHFFLELALIQSYHIRSGLKIWSKKIKTAFFGHPLPDDSNSHFRKSKIFVKWLSDSH